MSLLNNRVLNKNTKEHILCPLLFQVIEGTCSHQMKRLSDTKGNWTHHHLVRKWTIKHLAKLAKWISCVLRNYLYSAFDCTLLSCHIRVPEWTTHLNHLASLTKWLSVPLQTKWLWAGIPLLSLNLQISRLFQSTSSLKL